MRIRHSKMGKDQKPNSSRLMLEKGRRSRKYSMLQPSGKIELPVEASIIRAEAQYTAVIEAMLAAMTQAPYDHQTGNCKNRVVSPFPR
jgi:hypothetical protein